MEPIYNDKKDVRMTASTDAGITYLEAVQAESQRRSYPNIINAICATAWAIVPEKLEAIIDVLELRMATVTADPEQVEKFIAARQATKAKNVKGNVAVISLVGTISQRFGLMQAGSGGVSTDAFGQAFDELIADDSVGAIVIDTDSPGGNVYGVQELSEKIYNARGKKPIIAVANSMMASAAYWIASAADEVVATLGAEVGSIGVIAVHSEGSAANEMLGFKNTIVRAGKYKGENNPLEPITDEGLRHLQARLDDYYGMFTGAIARNRNVKSSEVRNGFGEGRLIGATEALEAGMIDRIATLDSVIERLTAKPKESGASRRAMEIYKRK